MFRPGLGVFEDSHEPVNQAPFCRSGASIRTGGQTSTAAYRPSSNCLALWANMAPEMKPAPAIGVGVNSGSPSSSSDQVVSPGNDRPSTWPAGLISTRYPSTHVSLTTPWIASFHGRTPLNRALSGKSDDAFRTAVATYFHPSHSECTTLLGIYSVIISDNYGPRSACCLVSAAKIQVLVATGMQGRPSVTREKPRFVK